MYPVKAKKHLGQHFLKDDNIARKIVASLNDRRNILEIGPGTGILTQHLLQIENINLKVIEIDKESVEYLDRQFPLLKEKIIYADFLHADLKDIFDGPFSIIGNFPYNISSQILFRVLEERDRIHEVVGMFQKEVASRIASRPGNKEYGILSVLLQAYYTIEYLFTVNENVFVPPPKVKSAVIRLARNEVKKLDCDEKLFFRIIKTAFNQRRKMLRNALSSFQFEENKEIKELLTKRAEQLNVGDFVFLTSFVNRKED
jgi:16S rRNA (adenine1518-N6/adenine1519-N6)-dimethyltransferase